MSSSSASFKFHLELDKIGFVLSSPKYVLSLLSTKQSQVLLKSLPNCLFYVSDFNMLEVQG